MAYNKPPSKTKLRKRSGVARKDRRKTANEQGQSFSAADFYEIKNIQATIDEYNDLSIFEIDPFFKTFQLSGEWIITRQFHENLIKYIDESDPENPEIDPYFRQIDARERSTDVEQYIPTPFPFLEEGVIVAISVGAQLHFAKRIEEAKKLGIPGAEDLRIPQVGDIIEVKSNYSSMWFKESRYYIDKQKQCEDFVFNPRTRRLYGFERYFRFDSYDFTAIMPIGHRDGKKGYFAEDGVPEWVASEQKRYEELDAKLKEQRDQIVAQMEQEAEQDKESDQTSEPASEAQVDPKIRRLNNLEFKKKEENGKDQD